MPIDRFSQHIAEVSDGMLDDELTEVMQKAVKEIANHGGRFEISLKIKITGKEVKDNFFVDIVPTYTTKHTPVDIGGSSYQCTPDNQLTLPDHELHTH